MTVVHELEKSEIAGANIPIYRNGRRADNGQFGGSLGPFVGGRAIKPGLVVHAIVQGTVGSKSSIYITTIVSSDTWYILLVIVGQGRGTRYGTVRGGKHVKQGRELTPTQAEAVSEGS